MVCAADNQIFYINIKGIGYIIKRFKVGLNRITAPFTYSAIGFSNLFCKPFCSASTTLSLLKLAIG